MEENFAEVAAKAWEVSGIGLLTVFAVLIGFALLIKLMIRIFPAKEDE